MGNGVTRLKAVKKCYCSPGFSHPVTFLLIPFISSRSLIAIMLGLTELDEAVCQWLSRYDLVQCAQVSKQWHSVVIPRLWHDISWISSAKTKKTVKAICSMVIEDYFAELHCQELQKNDDSMEGHSKAQPLTRSTLLKYGHWIRKLPATITLESGLRLPIVAGQDKAPTSHELLLHLFKRCSPKVQVNYLSIGLGVLDLDSDNPENAVFDFCLPRLRHIFIGDFYNSMTPSDTPKLTDLLDLLDRNTTASESLDIDVDLSRAGIISMKEGQTGDGPKSWASLKVLSLRKCTGSTDTNAFLSWLLKKCAGIKELRINECTGIEQALVEGMLAHLPNLDNIAFGENCPDMYSYYMQDDLMALLLSGSSKGWRRVKFWPSTKIGGATMDALSKHASTLEILDVEDSESVTSDQLIQLLSSCTRLHTLSSLRSLSLGNVHAKIDAKVFAKTDPDTGSLKPWQCEQSLKVLEASITGVPRPDLTGRDVVAEAYPGQARELHGQVYDRLARLTNLETLCLGLRRTHSQYDCLEISLESGLDKLSGLKRLKELDVTGTRTRIGLKEVQWMTEHWPRLTAIYGLCEEDKDEEVVRWLRENRPHIEVK